MTTPAAPKFAPPRREQPCPCGAGPAFGACCEPILLQQKPAADAEKLMRSRFTAHVARDYAHLHRSYLGTSREPYVATGEEATTAWTRLVIHAHETGPKADFATVDFTAYYKENDTEQALHEKGEFQKIEGIWYYARAIRQGPAPIISGQAKVGRNDPCPCGSKKKYKQCCLRKA